MAACRAEVHSRPHTEKKYKKKEKQKEKSQQQLLRLVKALKDTNHHSRAQFAVPKLLSNSIVLCRHTIVPTTLSRAHSMGCTTSSSDACRQFLYNIPNCFGLWTHITVLTRHNWDHNRSKNVFWCPQLSQAGFEAPANTWEKYFWGGSQALELIV